jgi:hypothetical protein
MFRPVRDPSQFPRQPPVLPFMGRPELLIRRSFATNFNELAAFLRGPIFAHEISAYLRNKDVDATLKAVDNALIPYANTFMAQYASAVAPVIEKGMERGRYDIENIRKDAGQSSAAMVLPQPERPVPTWRRQTPVRMFPIPRRKFQVQPAVPNARDFHGGWGLAPETYITSAQYLPYDLIVRITAGQREAIRQAIVDAITRGYDAPLTGVVISNLVGLFPRWQKAVTNFYRGLMDRGMNQDVAVRRANLYGDKLRAKRGIMIARTEIMRAQNYGRKDGWEEQSQELGFSTALSLKKWHAAPDACDGCRAMDGFVVQGTDTPFPWPQKTGEILNIVMPPAHPHCRCTATIKPVWPTDE